MPGVTAAKDFNFPGKTRWLKSFPRLETPAAWIFSKKDRLENKLADVQIKHRKTEYCCFLFLFFCLVQLYKITCCQWCDCEEYLRTDTESVHNITCCSCTSGTDMKIPTCRIRSPSFMRPSFAAMLFGSTCTKEVENQCWQPITTQLCISKRQQRCTTLAPPLFYVMFGENDIWDIEMTLIFLASYFWYDAGWFSQVLVSCKGNGDTYEAVNKSNERKKGKKKLKTCVCGINIIVFSRMCSAYFSKCISVDMHISYGTTQSPQQLLHKLCCSCIEDQEI